MPASPVMQPSMNASQMDMVPLKEFENLKQLTLQIEKEATETINRKDGHIKSLIEEIASLKEGYNVDFEELKLQSEIRITDLETKLKRQSERLGQFEAKSEFEDVLQTYNTQMCNLESENNVLLQEIKRTCKVESIHTKIKNEIAEKKMEQLTCEQV